MSAKKAINHGNMILNSGIKTAKMPLNSGIYQIRIDILTSSNPSSIGYDILLTLDGNEYILRSKKHIYVKLDKDTTYSFFNCSNGDVVFDYNIKEINFL
jgi:hypothetical protein